MTDTGHGATVTFGTSSWTGNIIDVTPPVHSRPEIEANHLTLATFEKTLAGDLVKLEPSPITFEFDPDTEPPYSAVDELITITFPVPSGGSTGATFAGDGRFISFAPPQLATNQKMVATGVISWAGTNVAWSDST
jgi:hypothetical protein